MITIKTDLQYFTINEKGIRDILKKMRIPMKELSDVEIFLFDNEIHREEIKIKKGNQLKVIRKNKRFIIYIDLAEKFLRTGHPMIEYPKSDLFSDRCLVAKILRGIYTVCDKKNINHNGRITMLCLYMKDCDERICVRQISRIVYYKLMNKES